MIPISKAELIELAIKKLSKAEVKYILSKLPKFKRTKRTTNAKKPVYAYNVITKLQIEYKSGQHAAKSFGVTSRTIYSHIKSGKPLENRKLSYTSFH